MYSGTTAKRILFDGNIDGNKRVTGVKMATLGIASYKLNARREMTLSAGAFQSPQLLMVSGVAPTATLRQFGIPVVADRPELARI